jgi:hypothetical protein
MKEFKSLVVVPQPPERLWTAVRDRLQELVPLLDDIDAVTVESRETKPDGTVHIVNSWRARPPIPAALAAALRPEMLSWTDRAEWRADGRECRWRIEPHFYPERTRCRGVTLYEAAMAGRGTRVTFVGTLEVSAANLAGVPAFLEEITARAIESFVTSMIPRNFQKLVRVAADWLGGATGEAAPR